MTELPLPVVVALVVVAFVAGAIDAMAGGGGLLTVPALLAAGLPPQLAFGTNKGQSVFGSFAALVRYARAGLIDPRRFAIGFPSGMVGAFAGALGMLALDKNVLRPVALALLVAAGIFVAVRPMPKESALTHQPRRHPLWLLACIALVIGAYDGFFGPGTGTFLIVAFVGLLHDSLPKASAEAKVVNFSSNVAAVGLFWSRGVVLWHVALPMAVGQFIGGLVGAHLAVAHGTALIRRAVLVVVVALVIKLAIDAI